MKRWRQIAIGLVTVGALGVIGLTPASGTAPTTKPPNGPAATPAFAPAVVTPAIQENVYVPVAPCRIVDTRAGVGLNHTPLSSNETRTFSVGGTFGFAPQGGKSGGCGVPVGASAVTATVAAVAAPHAGYLKAWATGSPEPLAVVLNFSPSPVTSTGATLTIGPSAQGLQVKAAGSTTHVVIDVTGYYVAQLAAFLQSDGTLTYATSRVVSTTHPSTGNYEVTFTRDISKCAYQVTPYAFNWVVAVGPVGPNSLHVYIHDQVSPFTAHDTSFFVTVTC